MFGKNFNNITLLCITALCCLISACKPTSEQPAVGPAGPAAEVTDSIPGWPRAVKEVEITASYDSTAQPALFWAPDTGLGPRPLLVALHTWSGNYRQRTSVPYWTWCEDHNWVFVHPDFRGPNHDPSAGGSLIATSDILDAAAYACAHAVVDTTRIYLAGVSGGGHMSLLTAGREPGIWAAVSAWVPITDLAAWHRESVERENKYAGDLEAICGGAPGESEYVDSQYTMRSPLTVLAAARGLPVEICAGVHDGHTGSVPVSHTLRGFNMLAEANGMPEKKLSPDEIDYFVTREKTPPGLAGELPEDPAYESNPVLFRREAGPARVTVFEGGHQILPAAALQWLSTHSKGRL